MVEIPATDLAVDLGNIMTASMVMLGAYVAATDMVSFDALDAAVAESLPPYRTQHVALNVAALAAGRDAAPDADRARVAPKERRSTREHGAHPRHRRDRRRGVQGLRPVHRRLPAPRPGDDGARGQHPRLPLPAAARRLHRVPGVRVDLPRLLFQVYKYDTPPSS